MLLAMLPLYSNENKDLLDQLEGIDKQQLHEHKKIDQVEILYIELKLVSNGNNIKLSI